MKLLTNSARKCFGACHRKYQYRYVMRRVPAIESEALRFGTLVHKALEAWWSNLPDVRLLSALEVLFIELNNGTDPYTIATARAIIHGYDSRYGSQELSTHAVECEFRAPLINPDTEGVSRTWMLAGKLDAICVDSNNRFAIVEHKTTSDSVQMDSDYWKKLTMDGQVSGYYLGARSMGIDVTDCIYDVLKKPTMRPSQIPLRDEDGFKIVLDRNGERVRTKDGKKFRESGDTEQGFVLQSRIETCDEWEERLHAEIMSDLDKYFARRNVARLESDMLDYLTDMWAVGREIADAETLNRFARNTDSCDGYGKCEYFAVCCGEDSIDNANNFRTIENENQELNTKEVANVI